MKFFIVFVFCLMQTFSQAQTLLKESQLGLLFSIDRNYRTLKNSSNNPNTDHQIDSKNELEVPKAGATIGIGFSSKLYKPFFFELGLLYSSKAYKTKDLIMGNNVSPTLGFTGTTSIHSIYKYIDIPTKLIYSIGKSGLKFNLGLGLNHHWKISSQLKEINKENDGSKTGTTSNNTEQGIKGYCVSGLGQFGLEKNIHENIAIKINAIYDHSLTPINKNDIHIYLHSTQFQIGVYYALKSTK